MARPPLLQIHGVSKRFDNVLANDHVDLEVRRGEIHALLGENGAGKSTLVKLLFGIHEPDSGEIYFAGRRVQIGSPRDALSLGIAMVHQHFMLVPDMTVAENIALAQPEGDLWTLEIGRAAATVREMSERYRFHLQPDDIIEDLPVGLRQQVEILKVLTQKADLLVFDEPTAVLTSGESEQLAKLMRTLADEGKAIIFITHKLEEVMSITDRCTVLRDGRVVGVLEREAMERRVLAKMMVGRDVTLRAPYTAAQLGEEVLATESLTLVDAHGRPRLDDVTISVHAGEILGVAGVDGNGQSELIDVLTGMRRFTSGGATLAGCDIDAMTPAEFIRRGGAIVPEDRHIGGLALGMSVLENLTLEEDAQRRFSHAGIIDGARLRSHCHELLREFDVRAAHLDLRAGALSGGNQQKLVLARTLSRRPRFLIAANPTRGLDVGAMEFVYQRLMEYKRGGGATLLISSDLEEILSISDRVAVLVGGRCAAILDRNAADPEVVGLLMAGASATVPH